jgi:hypothetical protein
MPSTTDIFCSQENGYTTPVETIGLLHHLRRIACGMLLPEVVVQFAGKPSLIAIIGNLPIPEQRRIANGGTVRVLVLEAGDTTHRMMQPLAMTPQQVRQAFANDHLRDDAEQAAILMRKRQENEGPRPKRIGELQPDYERVGVVVGKTGKFIPLADLIAAVNALRK